MQSNSDLSEFLDYLIDKRGGDTENAIPSLAGISDELGISLSRLREQVEVAKNLGFIEVKPRTGIKCLEYSFFPAVWLSLLFAIRLDEHNFSKYSDLRMHIEKAYWFQAVALLNESDHEYLSALIKTAWDKLNDDPIRIPHAEHRLLHISIYKKLDNPFVIGLLEAYWDAYEKVGLSIFADLNYHKKVWWHHEKMVEAIRKGQFDTGYEYLDKHFSLLYERPGKQINTIA